MTCSLVVSNSYCQCKLCNRTGFKPSILWQIGDRWNSVYKVDTKNRPCWRKTKYNSWWQQTQWVRRERLELTSKKEWGFTKNGHQKNLGTWNIILFCRQFFFKASVSENESSEELDRILIHGRKIPVLRIRILDPVPFWPQDPGWVKSQDPDRGWKARIIFPRD